jgi:glycosyltransferase involved in cell wall biosynthesis
VLPRVRFEIPGVRLRIVGRDAGAEVRALARVEGVEVTGTVPDVMPHLAEAHVMAVPLDAGGGTRLKILEAFAAGLPVVSTPIGAEGLDVIHGRDIWLATRARFADGLVQILKDRQRAATVASHARQLVIDRYDWSAIGRIACAAVAAAANPVAFQQQTGAIACAGSEMVS